MKQRAEIEIDGVYVTLDANNLSDLVSMLQKIVGLPCPVMGDTGCDSTNAEPEELPPTNPDGWERWERGKRIMVAPDAATDWWAAAVLNYVYPKPCFISGDIASVALLPDMRYRGAGDIREPTASELKEHWGIE